MKIKGFNNLMYARMGIRRNISYTALMVVKKLYTEVVFFEVI